MKGAALRLRAKIVKPALSIVRISGRVPAANRGHTHRRTRTHTTTHTTTHTHTHRRCPLSCIVPTSALRRQACTPTRHRTLQPQTHARPRIRVGSARSVAAPFRRSARHDRTACSITTIVSRVTTRAPSLPPMGVLGTALTSQLCRIPSGRQGTRALITRRVGRNCSQSATSGMACSITATVGRVATAIPSSLERWGTALTSWCRNPRRWQGKSALSTRLAGRQRSRSATCRRSAPYPGREGRARPAAGRRSRLAQSRIRVEQSARSACFWRASGQRGKG